MNSSRALRSICYECEKNMAINKTRCPFRSISNEFCEEYNLIKKDLEILEILKKHYNINSLTTSLDSFISFFVYKTDKDFEKIKEWLEE